MGRTSPQHPRPVYGSVALNLLGNMQMIKPSRVVIYDVRAPCPESIDNGSIKQSH